MNLMRMSLIVSLPDTLFIFNFFVYEYFIWSYVVFELRFQLSTNVCLYQVFLDITLPTASPFGRFDFSSSSSDIVFIHDGVPFFFFVY